MTFTLVSIVATTFRLCLFHFLVLCSLSLVFSALFFITLFYISYIQSIALNPHLNLYCKERIFSIESFFIASLDTIVCSPLD